MFYAVSISISSACSLWGVINAYYNQQVSRKQQSCSLRSGFRGGAETAHTPKLVHINVKSRC